MSDEDEEFRQLFGILKSLVVDQQSRAVDGEASELGHMVAAAAGRLAPRRLFRLIDGLLLLNQALAVKDILAHLQHRLPNEPFVARVASYLAADMPSVEDVARASYCLKSTSYESLSSDGIDVLRSVLTTLMPRLRLRPESQVLDLACGTGLVGAFLREHGFVGPLVGVDLSPEMLAMAKSKGAYTSLECRTLQDYVTAMPGGLFHGVFFLNVAPLLSLEAMNLLLSELIEKIAMRGVFVFNLPNLLDHRLDLPCCASVEPILKQFKIRFTAMDRESRRYYACWP